MGISFIYAGRRGSGLEATLALHSIARKCGFSSQLILSQDNERAALVRKLYPEAKFFNFLSPSSILSLRHSLKGRIAFFTMVSPKMLPLFLSLPSKKVFYFHASYDYSLSGRKMRDHLHDLMHDVLIKNSSLTLATQKDLARQIKERLGVDAQVFPHPPYSPIKPSFFSEEEEVKLPFGRGSYFLNFGEISRPSKGSRLLLEAVQGTNLKVVLAGRLEGVINSKNTFHLNRWVSDGELHHLIKNCRAVALPYILKSQFSGCLALSFHFRKSVLAPDSQAFAGLVEEGKTGWLFKRADAGSLKEKMKSIAAGRKTDFSAAIAQKEKEMEAATARRLKEIAKQLS